MRAGLCDDIVGQHQKFHTSHDNVRLVYSRIDLARYTFNKTEKPEVKGFSLCAGVREIF